MYKIYFEIVIFSFLVVGLICLRKDGNRIEAVWMKFDGSHESVCISSQVCYLAFQSIHLVLNRSDALLHARFVQQGQLDTNGN